MTECIDARLKRARLKYLDVAVDIVLLDIAVVGPYFWIRSSRILFIHPGGLYSAPS